MRLTAADRAALKLVLDILSYNRPPNRSAATAAFIQAERVLLRALQDDEEMIRAAYLRARATDQ